jgi:hypothetical protein
MNVILVSGSADGVTATSIIADEVVVGGERIVRPSSTTVVVVV